MDKKIKTKEKLTKIKEFDKKENIKHFSKPIHIKEKVDEIQNKKTNHDENHQKAPQQSAVQSITNQEKRVAHDSIFYARKFVENRRNKNQHKKQIDLNDVVEDSGISIKTHSAFKETRKKQLLNTKTNHVQMRSVNKMDKHLSKPTNHIPFRSVNKSNYQKHMKRQMLTKYKQKIKETKLSTNSIKKTSNKVKDMFKGTITVVKKAVTGIHNLIAAGSFLIFLVVLVLFMAVFSVLSSDSGFNSETLPLSPEVLAYTETIEKYAKDYDMEDYINIIQAVMMQESSGQGNDPMQSSECPHNIKYPQKPNGITDPDYSIQVGIHYLSDCFKSAEVKDPFDIDHISLALQGYNYGGGYISWAVTNFGGYTKANAKVISDMKKSELGWTTYGDPEYVSHVMRYVGVAFRGGLNPNFNNVEAWQTKNPYAQVGLYGQCTWFAWGRFYEMYGYSPGFIGDGWKCVDQLLKTHPDKFKRSDVPKVGAVFSCIGRNHVGIVVGWDGTNITIQEGNLDGVTNTFAQAKKDWHTASYTLDQFKSICIGVVFANPK
ncbi:lysozyme family protein [Thomasclavelia ramosa]|uniref:lysozyme family protein n=1 Tax=Thomasclavelia ramosa TaxID=1547 RepID=UPI001D072A08|nr:lysozyme family protein [Thomasclavelia ramosa]MCB6435866.1 lysozyme family protein [Thomasclavelia ramosa]MCB6458915.1 lysozyme family protein [Thomasclavelia ramosa]MCB6597105.1 lysozyme family protein [Thomasclavelia ramosa]MCB6600636.1 lysozyme family protein [Thomasclavelia ramosa]MCB6618685.1 lysozyme family protein [Thomasclavelia ramosa]